LGGEDEEVEIGEVVTMTVQERNPEHDALHQTDEMLNHYRAFHEPIGDIGIWNGQFETDDDGVAPEPEGWQWEAATSDAFTHETTGGAAGGKWVKFVRPAGGWWWGGLLNLRYFPFDIYRDYYVSLAVKSSNTTSSIDVNYEFYDENWTALGNLFGPTIQPTTDWTRRQIRVGPNGDTPWPVPPPPKYAYVRMSFSLKPDAQNEWVGIDDVQFQQMKATYSPLIRLMDGRVDDATDWTFTKQVYTVHAGSPITIYFEEPGYLWYSYVWTWKNSATRTNALGGWPHIDGVGQTTFVNVGLTADYYDTRTITMRSDGILARGNHTVDMRFHVFNAGDVCTVYQLNGVAYYTRAY